MIYITHYDSPIGDLLIASRNNKLIGLWIEDQKNYLGNFKDEMVLNNEFEILKKTKKWLDRYFKGERPNINELDIEFTGSNFRNKVFKILCKIPYGEVITYKDIALMLNKNMSYQAIGGAVSHNPILIIVPCHRVIGSNGSLTGYAGGIDKKSYLLKLEGVDRLF